MITPGAGHLAENVLAFARLLRRLGLAIGPGQVIEALTALSAIDVFRRDDFRQALFAVFVSRRSQHEVFDRAFDLFFRPPRGPDPGLLDLLPELDAETERSAPAAASRRVMEAMRAPGDRPTAEARDEVTVDAAMTWSDREVLRIRDFEQMSADELREARQAIAGMRLWVRDVPTRRFRTDPRGPRLDMRAMLRASLRRGGDTIVLRRRARRLRPPPLVLVCDISGSMGRYSRMLLSFMHAVTSDRDRVSSFVFGTRLTPITHELRHADPDVALARVGRTVTDWAGGTRIGACLRELNVRWSRRVLSRGAVVLLITDGLDRESPAELAREMERLHRSCRRLIWLNPLLRFEGFEPKARGIAAMLPHVDEHRPVHNLRSLEQLATALSRDAVAPRPPLRGRALPPSEQPPEEPPNRLP